MGKFQMFLVGVLAASLGACADQTPAPIVTMAPPVATPIPATAPVKPPVAKPAALPPPPVLLGKSEADTLALLGSPQKYADTGLGKVFTYQAKACQMEVHLFPDMEKGGFYALDYKATGESRENCLSRLSRAKVAANQRS